jgi:hypothetical protein
VSSSRADAGCATIPVFLPDCRRSRSVGPFSGCGQPRSRGRGRASRMSGTSEGVHQQSGNLAGPRKAVCRVAYAEFILIRSPISRFSDESRRRSGLYDIQFHVSGRSDNSAASGAGAVASEDGLDRPDARGVDGPACACPALRDLGGPAPASGDEAGDLKPGAVDPQSGVSNAAGRSLRLKSAIAAGMVRSRFRHRIW